MRILGLIFTLDVSLEIWVKQGLLAREKQIYEEHLKEGHFDKVIWFTYGVRDAELRNNLVETGKLDDRIEVVAMPKSFKKFSFLYSILMPVVKYKECKKLCMIKTNQMGGAWTAEIIHKLYNVPFILRTGYTYTTFIWKKSENVKKKYAKWKMKWKYTRYRKVENRLYHKCNVAMVSSEHDRNYICDSYGIDKKKVRLLTNYIDCDLFMPIHEVNKKERFLFVGRLEPQKNLFNLLEAIGQLGKGIDIYGEGSLRTELENLAREKEYDVCFKGVVSNSDMPAIYNQYLYYILPSEYEGMPKTLLEAMACGLVSVGTDVTGISEVIQNGQNGFLAKDVTIERIKEAILNCGNAEYSDVSDRAVDYISNKHSLRTVTNEEWGIMRQFL